jgi:hypothetical protein
MLIVAPGASDVQAHTRARRPNILWPPPINPDRQSVGVWGRESELRSQVPFPRYGVPRGKGGEAGRTKGMEFFFFFFSRWATNLGNPIVLFFLAVVYFVFPGGLGEETKTHVCA